MLCIRSFFRIFAAEIFINMNILGRLFIYIRRINHCKGFGVQSPFAYKFITDVINEHYSDYIFEYQISVRQIILLIVIRTELFILITSDMVVGKWKWFV